MGNVEEYKTLHYVLHCNKRDYEEVITPPIDDALLTALLRGETITREKAMNLPIIAGNVDFISNTIASMPIKLYKRSQNKIICKDNDIRVKLLNNDTGDTLDGFQFKKALIEDALLGKGGFAYIRRYRNEVTGLFYVEDKHVSIMKNYDPVFKDYKILVNAKQYRPYEFLKLLRRTKDGSSSISLVNEISKDLETAYQMLLYQLCLVQSGGNKKGFLKSARKLGQDEINTLKTAWKNLYANNENNIVVLNNGLEFQEASNSSVEMQLNESKRNLQYEIDKIFHIKGDFYSTFKEAIYPIIKAFETALNRDLLLEKEKKAYFFEFDVKEIIKSSIKERYEAYQMAKNTGFMTINEIRNAENMEAIAGMDVINVGLSAVLYDTNSHTYYTPNTNATAKINENNELETEKPGENEEKTQAEEKTEELKILDEEVNKDWS